MADNMKKWGLDFIRKLKPCFWKYKLPRLNDGRYHFGMVAQDIIDIVSKDDFGFVTVKEFEDGRPMYRVNYFEFMGPLIAAIQQLDQKVKKLEKELKTVKGNK